MAKLSTIWSVQSPEERLFYGFGLLIFLSIAGALLTEEYLLMATPGVVLMSAIRETRTPYTDHMPFGSSLSASLACWF